MRSTVTASVRFIPLDISSAYKMSEKKAIAWTPARTEFNRAVQRAAMMEVGPIVCLRAIRDYSMTLWDEDLTSYSRYRNRR